MREIKFKFLMENGEITDPYYLIELIDSDSYINIECEYSSSKIKQELQYTGLKDKNGIEIYEGDILELIDWWDDSVSIHPVFYKNSAFMCQRLDDKEFPFFYLQGNDDLKDGYKIIGNIYENPELLELE